MIDDAMNLALTGRMDYRIALDVTSYIAHERSYVPWKARLFALGYIDTMLSKGAHYLEYGNPLDYENILSTQNQLTEEFYILLEPNTYFECETNRLRNVKTSRNEQQLCESDQ